MDVGLVWTRSTLSIALSGLRTRFGQSTPEPLGQRSRRKSSRSKTGEKACQYIHEAFRQHFSGFKADFVNAFQPSKLSLFGPILGWISDAASKTSVALIFLVARTIRYHVPGIQCSSRAVPA